MPHFRRQERALVVKLRARAITMSGASATIVARQGLVFSVSLRGACSRRRPRRRQMNKLVTLAAASLTGLMLVGAAVPASAQSVGFSFGFGNHDAVQRLLRPALALPRLRVLPRPRRPCRRVQPPSARCVFRLRHHRPRCRRRLPAARLSHEQFAHRPLRGPVPVLRRPHRHVPGLSTASGITATFRPQLVKWASEPARLRCCAGFRQPPPELGEREGLHLRAAWR